MNEKLASLHEGKASLIIERQDAIRKILQSYQDLGIIKPMHTAGPIIDCFTHVGVLVSILRKFGPKFTLVELDPASVETGIMLDYINLKKDIIKKGVNAEKYLQIHSLFGPKVNMVTCFGMGDSFLKDPNKFHRRAMKILNLNGLLFMTGTKYMKKIFRDYVDLFGCKLSVGNEESHAWDYFRYFKTK